MHAALSLLTIRQERVGEGGEVRLWVGARECVCVHAVLSMLTTLKESSGVATISRPLKMIGPLGK